MSVSAVIICFNPDLNILRKSCEIVLPQVEYLILVDNSDSCVDLSNLGATEVITVGDNKGIGVALNIGLEASIRLGADRVLLMDQDSMMYFNAISALSKVLDEQQNCAIVGPLYKELNSGQVAKFTEHFDGVKKNWLQCVEGCVPTTAVISSGSMIRIRAFLEIGEMREDFFIDYVDTEWCYRARRMGYEVLGLKEILMDHRIGESHIRFWLGRWRYVQVHESWRYYFIFRNGLRLVFDPEVRKRERLKILFRTIVYLLLLSHPGFKQGSFRQAIKGALKVGQL